MFNYFFKEPIFIPIELISIAEEVYKLSMIRQPERDKRLEQINHRAEVEMRILEEKGMTIKQPTDFEVLLVVYVKIAFAKSNKYRTTLSYELQKNNLYIEMPDRREQRLKVLEKIKEIENANKSTYNQNEAIPANVTDETLIIFN